MIEDTKTVPVVARLYLEQIGAGVEISTNELMEAIYPHADMYEPGAPDPVPERLKTRKTIYTMLTTLAKTELKDCCRKGDATGRKFMGKLTRPWVWFQPPERDCCLFCGQVLPV